MNISRNLLRSNINTIVDYGIFKYFIFFYFFHAGVGIENSSMNIAGNFGFGDIGILLSLIFLIFYKIDEIKINLFIFIPVVFGILTLASLINLIILGLDMHPSPLGYLVRWFFYGIVLLVLTNFYFSKKDLIICLMFLLFGFFTQTVVVWLNWFQAGVSFMNIPTLAYIEEYNSNTIGFYMSIAYATSISLFLKEIKSNKKSMRIIYLILSIIFLFSGFLTLSKGAWACLLMISFFFLIKNISINFRSFLFIIGIGITIFLMTFYLSDYFDLLEIVLARIDSSTGSTNQRIDMFLSTFEIMRDYTWFGAGPKSYELYGLYYVDGGHMSKDPHTALGGIFAELGIFAGFFYIFILFLLIPFEIFNIIRNKHESYLWFLMVNIWMILVIFSFLSGMPSSDKILWILLSIIYFLRSYKNRLPSVV